MTPEDFQRVQRLALAGASAQEVSAALPPGARLAKDRSCPSCHCGYVARLPGEPPVFLCLACGLEFEG